MIIDGSMLISSSIWGEDFIRSDVWTEGPLGPDPENTTGRIASYYLKQMNFIGNEF